MSPEDKQAILTDSELLHFLNGIAGTEGGMGFLRWLCHDICTYHDTSATLEMGKSSINATLYNEGRKSIWRNLRPYFAEQYLGAIESFDVRIQHERIAALDLEDEDQEKEQEQEEENNHE